MGNKGRLGKDNYESYVESRCGIYQYEYQGNFYKRVKVGYKYYDHGVLE